MPTIIRTSSQEECDRAKQQQVERGTPTFELVTLDSCERDDFFRAALRCLPMGDATEFPEHPHSFPSGWDAFSDFLFQGLVDEPQPVTIIWSNAGWLKSRCPDLFETAVEMLSFSAQVAESQGGPPVTIRIFEG